MTNLYVSSSTGRQIVGVVSAILSAALPPAIYFGIPDHSFRTGALVFLLASLWVVLLGLPTFYILKRHGLVRWSTAMISGFLLGGVPMALMSWPYRSGINYDSNAWDGHRIITYVVQGVPTSAGWVQYIYRSCGVGLLGAVSGVTFWIVWWLVVHPPSSRLQ